MKYEINGRVVEAESELSEAEIDEIASSFGDSAPTPTPTPTQQLAQPVTMKDKFLSMAKKAAPAAARAVAPMLPMNPVAQVYDTMHTAQALGAPGEMAGGAVAEKLGEKGVNPFVAGAAGMVTQFAADPTTWMSAGLPKVAGQLDNASAALVKQAEQFGLKLTPGELKSSKPLLLLERALENTPGGSAILKQFRETRVQQLTKLRDSLIADGAEPKAIERVGLELQDIAGKLIKLQEGARDAGASKLLSEGANKLGVSQEAPEILAKKSLEAIRAASQDESAKVSKAFEELSDIMPATALDIPANTVAAAKALLKNQKNVAPSLRSGRLQSIINDFIPKYEPGLVPEGQTLPEARLSWGQLKANREALTSLINEMDGAAAFGVKGAGTADVAALKQLKGAMSKDMEAMAEKVGGEVSEKYALARAMHGSFKDTFNNDVIRSVIKIADQRPDKFMQTVFAPGRTTEIKNVRRIIGEQRFNGLKERFTATLFGLDNPASAFNPATLRQQITRYKPNMLKEVYGEGAFDAMVKLADDVEKTGTMPIDNVFARSLLQQRPQKVMDYVIQPNNTVNIMKAKTLLGGKAWDDAMASWMDAGVLAKNPDAVVNPGQFVKLMSQYSEPTLLASMGKPRYEKFKQLAAVTRLMQRGEEISVNRSQTAGVGGMMGMLTSPVLAVLKLAGSTAVAKAYMSPSTMDLMIRGLGAMPNTQAALTAARNLSVALGIQATQEIPPQ